jgi:hypothetical protein
MVNDGGKPVHDVLLRPVVLYYHPPGAGLLVHDHCASTALLLVSFCVATQFVGFCGAAGYGRGEGTGAHGDGGSQ